MFFHFRFFFFFFFNDTAPTEIYTLSLHDALPILRSETLTRVQHEDGHVRPLDGSHGAHVSVVLDALRAGRPAKPRGVDESDLAARPGHHGIDGVAGGA